MMGRSLNTYILVLVIVTLLFPLPCLQFTAYAESREDLCIDMSKAYDQNFKWYNTNGSLPQYMGDYYLFTGGKGTNMYQDAISIRSIKVGKAYALSARVAINLQTLHDDDRDEFAIFVTDDTKVFTGDEFGFVFRIKSAALYGYIQSPRIPEFFLIFKISNVPIGQENVYNLKAVYTELNNKAIVRFFVNDINIYTHDFPITSNEELYLVISSKKLSPPSIDTSNNYMKVYSACIVNLPVPRVDSTYQDNVQTKLEVDIHLLLTLVLVTMLITIVLLLIKIDRRIHLLIKYYHGRSY